MRKILTVAVLAAALGAGLPANAADKTATILVPTGATGTVENCLPNAAGCEKTAVARHHRCVYTANGAAEAPSQGVLGYTVAVNDGVAYTLSTAAGSVGDFDITFYSKLGTCQRVHRDGVITIGSNPEPETRTDAWDEHHFGNESGVVPTGAKFAIITLFGGANAKFIYNES